MSHITTPLTQTTTTVSHPSLPVPIPMPRSSLCSPHFEKGNGCPRQRQQSQNGFTMTAVQVKIFERQEQGLGLWPCLVFDCCSCCSLFRAAVSLGAGGVKWVGLYCRCVTRFPLKGGVDKTDRNTIFFPKHAHTHTDTQTHTQVHSHTHHFSPSQISLKLKVAILSCPLFFQPKFFFSLYPSPPCVLSLTYSCELRPLSSTGVLLL